MLNHMLSQERKDFPNSMNFYLFLLKYLRLSLWRFVLYKVSLIHLDSHKKYLQLPLSHFYVLGRNIHHTKV